MGVVLDIIRHHLHHFVIYCGSVLKAGRRLVVVQSDIYSVNEKNEKLVAAMLGTIVPNIVAI